MRARVRIKPRFWACVIVTTVVLFGVLFVIQNGVMSSQNLKIAQLEKIRAEKLEENELLNKRIEFAKTKEYIERYARSELGMLKEGEIRFVVSGAPEQ